MSGSFEEVLIDSGYGNYFTKAKKDQIRGKPQIGRYVADHIQKDRKKIPEEIGEIFNHIIKNNAK